MMERLKARGKTQGIQRHMQRLREESSCDSTASSPSVHTPIKQQRFQENARRTRTMSDPKKTTNYKWPKNISRFFVSFLADQARARLKVDKGVKSAPMTAAVKAINEKFPGVKVTETNCLNHYRTLKGRWIMIKRAQDQSGVSWDDATKTILMDEEQYQSHIRTYPASEMFINKPIDQYDDLAQICGDDCATRMFARSIGEPMTSSMGLSDMHGVDNMNASLGSPFAGPSTSRKSGSKRNRQEKTNEQAGFAIANGLEELAKAIIGQEWINMLHDAIREMKEEYPKRFLDRALAHLGRNKIDAQIFMSGDYEERKEWLNEFATEL